MRPLSILPPIAILGNPMSGEPAGPFEQRLATAWKDLAITVRWIAEEAAKLDGLPIPDAEKRARLRQKFRNYLLALRGVSQRLQRETNLEELTTEQRRLLARLLTDQVCFFRASNAAIGGVL